MNILSRARAILVSVFIFALVAVSLPASAGIAQSSEIVIGTTDFPQSLDPATAVDLPSWEVMNHLYTGLTRQLRGSLSYELALAADHTISADGLTHTFALRDDITFDDGTPITAETFETSINRVIALGRDGADFINRYISSVEADTENCIIFHLRLPLPDFEALVGLPPFFPQHPASYPHDDVLPAEAVRALITNGQYRLESFEANHALSLVPSAAYTGPHPAVSPISLRHFTLPIDLRRALLNQQVDLAWRALALPDLEAIQEAAGLVTMSQPNLQAYYLLLNHSLITIGNQDSFDDPAVRQAFALLVDREDSARLGWDNLASPLYALIPPELDAAVPAFPGYDPELADQILEAAGYSPRRRPINTGILISSTAYGDLMRAAASELRSGIEASDIVNISGVSDSQAATFISAVNRGDYLSAIIGWRPHFASAAAYLLPLAHASAAIPAHAAYGSDQLNALLESAGRAASAEQRAAALTEAQMLLLANNDLLPLWQGKDTIVYQQGLSGVLIETNSWLRYDQLRR